MNRLIQLRTIIPSCFIAVLTAYFALSPTMCGQSCPSHCDSNYNTGEGDYVLHYTSTGSHNTAVGNTVLYLNTTGSYNTNIGDYALFSNTTGIQNTAIGHGALNGPGFGSVIGNSNTASGFKSLFSNRTGNNNTANGVEALFSNTSGFDNTANGFQALYSNRTGNFNTANGEAALLDNTTGSDNTADGVAALLSNTTGANNTATGWQALYSNTTGFSNTAAGYDALVNNTTGHENIAVGYLAGQNLTTGSNNIDIGNAGSAGESNYIRIGTVGTQTAAFIAGIHSATVSGTAVVVNSSGQLGVATSSVRFKEEIKPMDKASEAVLALKPVTFRYKKAIDPAATQQFGLVAEEVAKVNPALVLPDKEGKPYTVRYDAVNAMLLNEFLKEHRKVEQQRRDFEAALAQQQKQIDALAAGLQKVSTQIEASKAAPQVAENSQ